MLTSLQTILAKLPVSFHVCPIDMDNRALHPAEHALTVNFSSKRLAEFCSGRYCAHRALAEFGYSGFPVLRDAQGAPQWPAGMTGSISHSGAWAVAVVASMKRIRAIGIDLQQMRHSFPLQVLPDLLHSREIPAFLRACRQSSNHAYAVFSAKESAIKCGYLSDGRLFEPSELIVDMRWYPQTFTVARPHASERMKGYAGVESGYVFTLTWREVGDDRDQ